MTKLLTSSAPLAHRLTLFTQLPRRARRLLTAWPLALLLTMAHGAFAQPAYAPGGPPDPPGSVARASLLEGAVSFSPAEAGANGWTPATLNRPLTRGDRLWTGQRARSELHVGSTAVRMSAQTSLDFLALDDKLTQLRLAQGSVQLKVRTLFEGQRLEVDTPNLAFVVSAPGVYRLDVDPAGDTTRVVALSGSGVLYGDNGAALSLGQQQQGNFSGTQLTPAAPGPTVQDDFDVWAAARDQREDQSVSARYIPREIIGYQQLDTYGDWQQDPAYGAVWLPRAVPVNWAPYRAGHWDWIAPWGWTWVDDAPWGFAPFHYGRWAQIGPRWAWVPGQLSPRPVYAPALVAFVGDSSGGTGGGINWRISIGSGSAPQPGVGWFPLAPGEAFQPVYRASPRYISQVNNSIVVNNTVRNTVNNTVNKTVNSTVNVTNNYRYQYQPTAVTAVSRDDFLRGRPMQAHAQDLSVAELAHAPLLLDRNAMPPRPTLRDQSPQPAAAALPPAAVTQRPVIRSQGARGPEAFDPRAAKPETSDRNPRAQALLASAVRAAVPATPVPAPLAMQAPVAAQTPPVLHAQPAQAPERNALESEQHLRREQARIQPAQAKLQDQQRQQADEARAHQIKSEQALQQRQQIQMQQGQVQARQQADLVKQQEAQHRQDEAQQHKQAQTQQAHQDQLRQQQQQQQQQQQHQQQQQQRMVQQEQQKAQAQQHHQSPPAEADERAPPPKAEHKHNREP